MSKIKRVWFIGLSFFLGFTLFPFTHLLANTDQTEALPYQGVQSWQTETIADDARRNGSITVNSSNTPVIAYQTDGQNGEELTYAQKDGSTWTKEKVANNIAWKQISLDLDSNDYPHISYAICDPDCSPKYSHWTGSQWEIPQTMDGFGSLAISSADKIHIGYHHDDSQQVNHMYLSNSSWVTETVDSDTITNTHVALALDNNEFPRLSYYKGDWLYQADWSGAAWSTRSVGQAMAAPPDSGQYSAIAVDSNNRSHIAYYDSVNQNLRYTTGTGSAWIYRIIDANGDVGKYVSLALDSNNLPHFLYYDASNEAIKYAHQTENGWRTMIIEENVGDGGVTSIVIDSADRVHISYYVYHNPSDRQLKYAWGDLTPNYFEVYLPTIIK